jgi:Transposase zinc-ribbon domain
MDELMCSIDFQDRFRTEDDCLGYIEKLRWLHGFVCPNCGHDVGISSEQLANLPLTSRSKIVDPFEVLPGIPGKADSAHFVCLSRRCLCEYIGRKALAYMENQQHCRQSGRHQAKPDPSPALAPATSDPIHSPHCRTDECCFVQDEIEILCGTAPFQHQPNGIAAFHDQFCNQTVPERAQVSSGNTMLSMCRLAWKIRATAIPLVIPI